MENDPFEILRAPAEEVAPRLLGCEFERDIDGKRVRVRIVETEAYDQTDAASHSYKGRTPRSDVMFGPAGHLYVYFTYGMHYCCNVVTGDEGHGSGVLIRAVEPIEGEAVMAARRPHAGVNLTNGPAKLCQALGINLAMNGHDLHQPPMRLIIRPTLPKSRIISSPRIGISREKDRSWRFFIKGNPYVSS